MHFLAISLLTILAGTLLLAKSRKDMPGKFFAFISWFFIVVGFILFIGFIGGSICRMSHHGFPCQDGCRQEMMMNDHHRGMPGMGCCPKEMGKGMRMEMRMGMCAGKPCCMAHDSTMKCCSKHMQCDSAKMAMPSK